MRNVCLIPENPVGGVPGGATVVLAVGTPLTLTPGARVVAGTVL